jgi:hypothetical protein
MFRGDQPAEPQPQVEEPRPEPPPKPEGQITQRNTLRAVPAAKATNNDAAYEWGELGLNPLRGGESRETSGVRQAGLEQASPAPAIWKKAR